MSRPKGETGIAIRKILRKHKGRITFAQAMDKLKVMGIEIPDRAQNPKGFEKLRNAFNTTKYQSDKPDDLGKNKHLPQKKAAKRSSTMTSDEALEIITANGGMKSVEKKLVSLREEMEQLEEAVDRVTAYQNTLSKVG